MAQTPVRKNTAKQRRSPGWSNPERPSAAPLPPRILIYKTVISGAPSLSTLRHRKKEMITHLPKYSLQLRCEEPSQFSRNVSGETKNKQNFTPNCTNKAVCVSSNVGAGAAARRLSVGTPLHLPHASAGIFVTPHLIRRQTARSARPFPIA